MTWIDSSDLESLGHYRGIHVCTLKHISKKSWEVSFGEHIKMSFSASSKIEAQIIAEEHFAFIFGTLGKEVL